MSDIEKMKEVVLIRDLDKYREKFREYKDVIFIEYEYGEEGCSTWALTENHKKEQRKHLVEYGALESERRKTKDLIAALHKIKQTLELPYYDAIAVNAEYESVYKITKNALKEVGEKCRKTMEDA